MRTHSREYRLIAQKLIREETELQHINDYDIKIAYLICDEEKKKNRKLVYADCTKVSKQYDWCCDYDFFITVYEPNVIDLDDEKKRILLLHELKHVGVDDSGNEPVYYIVPHDVEDFDTIIERYGLHWEKEERPCQEETTLTAEQI